ncbi:GSCFA domain-containing protein [Gammaproteobacteria bacterium]|nr:GSCFA domain-containing protein [Gammaproteobacteria bacterium]
MKINNRWKLVEKSKELYLPTVPQHQLINNDTKLCLMGSCFADEIGWVLKENNINIGEVDYVEELRHVLYPWGTFFNPLNLLHILEHTLEIKKINFDEQAFIKVPKNILGNHFETKDADLEENDYDLWCLYLKARLKSSNLDQSVLEINKKLKKFKNSILNADVVVITLGLIEAWIDNGSKKSWHSFHGNAIKKTSIGNRASFDLLSYDKVTAAIQNIVSIFHSIDKEKKIIFTVSPIPLNFTFTNKDIVVANRYSKSVLRAAIEGFIDDKRIFYFPSFEIVLDCVGWPAAYKEDDKRHIKMDVFKNNIAPLFLNNFCDIK